MTELQITETVLLTIAGWILITLVVKDIILTARLCLAESRSGFGQTVQGSSSLWIGSAFSRAFKSSNWRKAVLKRLNILIPLLQIVIWKLMLIAGFALLYLAIDWQNQGKTETDNFADDLSSSLWLSLAVSLRLFQSNPVLEDPMIFLVANIQFYQGYLLFGFVCFYFLTLRQKTKRLQPRLYNLKNELGADYSPFMLSDCLRRYRTNNLLLILEDWERWAEELRNNLSLHPHLIYSGAKSESWAATLKIVLDTSAAMIISSGGAVERQARLTFGAARRALVEITQNLGLLQKNDSSAFSFQHADDESFGDKTDEVLSAELIVETEKSAAAREIEMFDVWRFTYDHYLQALSDELEITTPRRRFNRSER